MHQEPYKLLMAVFFKKEIYINKKAQPELSFYKVIAFANLLFAFAFFHLLQYAQLSDRTG